MQRRPQNRAQDELPLLAQQRGREAWFVNLAGSYHGETLGALSVTDVALFRTPMRRSARGPGAERTGGWRSRANRPGLPCVVPMRWVTPGAAQHGNGGAHREPLVQGASGMAVYATECCGGRARSAIATRCT